MSFETLSKAELADLVEKKSGGKPSDKLSKAQLIDILEAEGFPVVGTEEETNLPIGEGLQVPGSDLPPVETGDILEAEGFPVVGTEEETNLPIGEGLQVPGSDLPPVETGDILEAEDEGLIKIVKLDDDGQVIDSSSTSKDAWALLPEHKYGWVIAPPKEIA